MNELGGDVRIDRVYKKSLQYVIHIYISWRTGNTRDARTESPQSRSDRKGRHVDAAYSTIMVTQRWGSC